MSFVSLPEVLSALQKARTVAKGANGLKIGVAVDGSQISDKAATVAASLVDIKRGDRLNIIHIADKTKTYLPKNLHPSHLKNYYQDLAGVRIKSEWLCREKGEGESTCQVVTALADKEQIDLLVLGSFGRKGEKMDMLGTVSDFSLRESHASICIVRAAGSNYGRQAKFLFATDGSRAAALAFCVLTKMLMRPTDLVDVIMVSTDDGTAEQPTIDHYREFMLEHKIQGQAVVKCIDRRSTTIPDGVINAAKEMDTNILVLGISGYGRKKLGSVSEQISSLAHCTTLIIKDSYDVLSNRFTTGSRSIAAEFCPSSVVSR